MRPEKPVKPAWLLALALAWMSCNGSPGSDDFPKARNAMVQQQIAGRGVRDPRVLQAMREVPRHEFVPENFRRFSYEDHALPIGHGQTISQPYIVAFMTEKLA